MSSQAQGEGVETPKRRGLGRYVQRMRTVLRTGTRHPRESAGAVAPTGSSSQPATTSKQPPVDATPKPITAAKTASRVEEHTQKPGVVTISRAQIEQERAHRLAEKYGLTIEPHEWAFSNVTAERVEKPIRMRIHRTCHKCGSTFGSGKVCVKCEHVRCTKCPRYPVRKDKSAGDVGGKGKGVIGLVSTVGASGRSEDRRKFELTRPSRTGGQDLVRKKVTQRVRRNCHECGAEFRPANKTCQGCSHVRCVECPRDPAKSHLYPDGYPGDAPAPDTLPPERIKHPTRFKCHSCNTTFARGSTTCSCGHEKCEQCPRVPPKKLKHREFDADLIRRVEERLAALTVTTS